MTKIPDTDPVFPDDFRVLVAEGGASYWWWSPFTDDSYDGTWAIDEEPPSGLMIGCPEIASDVLRRWGVAVVSWEFGPETESGPFRDHIPVAPGLSAVQQAIADVMREVREDYEVAARYVDPDILREDLDERRSLDDD